MDNKAWWASKLMWLAVVEAIFGVVELVKDGQVTMDDWDAGLVLVAAALTAIFRAFTGREIANRVLAWLVCGSLLFSQTSLLAETVTIDLGSNTGDYVLSVKEGKLTAISPTKRIDLSLMPVPTPTPLPVPTPSPVVLSDRAKTIKTVADKVTDPEREQTAKGLASLYREIAKVAAQAKDEASLAEATSRGTNMFLASRSPSAVTAWQPVRDVLSTQWGILKTKPGVTVADFGVLLGEAADGLEASSPQRALDPAMWAFILEILKIILPLIIK